ncbi:RNA polymerase sigma factor [Diaminobutyricibacter sp. McL0608]|uniref:RNA polymerase sigma factor n=1 Tax=Leifsonia sp. McL0608 TaxID=3143537 RepID=UPI0031F31BA5
MSDADLIDRAAGRDVDAFAALYDRHVRTVYRYALSVVRQVPDAEDVTQEVFITAWKRVREIRIVDESGLPWLLTTTRYTSLNRVRAASRERDRLGDADLSMHPDARPGPVEELERRHLMVAVEDAVAALSENDQVLYTLCIEEGLSYADAARAMGSSHGAVRNRLARLRGTLRTRLTETAKGNS